MKFPITLFLILILALCQGSYLFADENSPEKFDFDVYKQRRQAVMDSIGNGSAVLFSRGHNGETGYRADSHFWYLTGLDQEGAILILAPGERDREILLLPSRDIDAERWTGWRPSLSDSLRVTWGFDRLSRTSSLNWIILSCVKHEPTLHLISSLVSPGSDVPPDLDLYDEISSRVPGVSIKNSSHIIESLRLIKAPEEISAIKKAIEITHRGISRVLAACKPGVTEYQLDGILEASYKEQGAQFAAFTSIIASGENGAILHYERHSDTVKDGELLLMDVGAEWNHYAADISRTFPVNGKFTDEQARVYDIVLEAQNAAFAAIKPGATTFDMHDAAVEVIKKAGYVDDFMHGTSHFLGLDVHDVGDRATVLKPGMVITVEPGIYLSAQGFGIRIEDDVLVTERGYEILSKNIPRKRDEVESWIARTRK